MKLTDLLKDTAVQKIVGWAHGIEISGVENFSRKVKKGNLFVAQKGQNFDGHLFVEEALQNGAVAVVVEEELPNYNVVQVVVKNARVALATLASTFFGNPSQNLKFVGVTGTNGKTSCALFLADMLSANGKPCAYIGTTGARFNGKEYSTYLTTPDPLVLHNLLAQFVQDGAKFVSMEVSAHALALQKVCNLVFEVGIITNITQDHLDFFGTMKNYSRAKLGWFTSGNVKMAVVNVDDKYCQSLQNKKIDLLTYGLDTPGDTFAVNIENHTLGTTFVLNVLDNVLNISTSLVGLFNVYNLLAVATAALCLGLGVPEIGKSIAALKAPTGRFNIIRLSQNKTIVVDFAHTPDGLEKALSSARKICQGKLIALFGCGGDRDKIKRPIMGKIAEQNADFCVLTSDNPRFERPENILADIETGMNGHNYLKIADRKLAIFKVVEMMRAGDVAVVCGKGGENYQDINGIKLPYDDFAEIKRCVKTLLGEDCTVMVRENLC